MSEVISKSEAQAILLFAVLCGSGFGLWMHNFGAGLFMATAYLPLIIAAEHLKR